MQLFKEVYMKMTLTGEKWASFRFVGEFCRTNKNCKNFDVNVYSIIILQGRKG